MGQDWVFSVVHSTISDSLKGQVEHFRFDLFLIFFVGNINAVESLVHDGGNYFILINILGDFCLFEDIVCSGIQVVFKSNLL